MQDYSDVLEEMGLGMTGIDLAGNLLSFAVGIVAYVFLAIGMYAIAKRRGIRNPWLAWIPFGSTWLLGCISDQYRYVTMGQEKSKRKLMLGLEIAVSATGVASIAIMIVALIKMFSLMDGEYVMSENSYYAEVLAPLMIALLLCFVMMGLAIALVVVTYIAVYDLFKSCNPEYATVFLVLSILFGSILQGIFVFANRKKDLGMPPRRDQIQYVQPVWQPQQPPVEPWEQNNERF